MLTNRTEFSKLSLTNMERFTAYQANAMPLGVGEWEGGIH
jgi:hypothetical protein